MYSPDIFLGARLYTPYHHRCVAHLYCIANSGNAKQLYAKAVNGDRNVEWGLNRKIHRAAKVIIFYIQKRLKKELFLYFFHGCL